MFRNPTYWGSSRFAKKRQLRPWLKAPGGLVVGHSRHGLLIDQTPTHALVLAPTRAGKGVSFVIPNCLTWPGSLVVLDVKKEAFAATSGYRAQHQPVFLWGPTQKAHAWNVLAELPDDESLQDNARRIAAPLLPGSDFWEREALDLLSALLCYLRSLGPASCLADIQRLLRAEDGFESIVQRALDSGRPTELVAGAFRHHLAKAEKEQSGVRSTITSTLGPWLSPTTVAATARSDFRLQSLFERPTTVYVAAMPPDLVSHRAALALFFEAFLAVATRSEPDADAVPVLLVLDEFPLLGELPAFEKSLAYLAGYGIRVAIIAQSLTQLHPRCREQIVQNCAVKVLYRQNDRATAEYFSALSGQTTLAVEGESKSNHGRTTSKSYRERALLLPHELRELPDDQALYWLPPALLVRGRKRPYYEDPTYTARLLAPAQLPEGSQAPGATRPIDELLACSAPRPRPRGHEPRATPVEEPPRTGLSDLLTGSDADAVALLETYLAETEDNP